MKVTIDMTQNAGKSVQVVGVNIGTREGCERLIHAIRRQMDLVWPQEKKPT